MIVVKMEDQILERFGTTLKNVGAKDARKIFMRALNRGGDQARTQTKRSLVKQTGIKYGLINKATTTKKAHPNQSELEYAFEANGTETNLNLFGAKQVKKGVSARPWGKRRVFKSTFIVGAYNGRVYKRAGAGRGPLEPVFGPNIARELMKDPTINYWRTVDGFVMKRVEHELSRLFK